ncbi:nitric oxide-sensing protein NosP [Pseudomaricurvus sp. HS19]|uniref:nitric oxide-sensing protein NosP n=1 Tax=Pseudomaricurvus sp. HS19 TaxID=2692626 RepID=UPI00136F5461|nr:nitric oxide-sensing protein NosP [Pseudomaricurvus sp. HS19]MYM64863.1 GfdT protein [Pseudomaricurvus sp. HS19]
MLAAGNPTYTLPENAVRSGGSSASDPAIAAQELYRDLAMDNTACVFFFCCVEYDREKLGRELTRLFGDTLVVGCTTAGEIMPSGLATGSISGFSLSAEGFVVEARLLEDLATFSERQAGDIITPMLESLDNRAIAPVLDHSFALSLLDGLSVREEQVLSALNDALQGIPLVGGSAGDSLHLRDTHIYFSHQFYNNAACIILINTIYPFAVMSGHHMPASAEKLVVTKADPNKRIAYEFNAEPAALEYCRMMGLSLDELQPASFARHPLAVQVGDNYYIRSIQRVNDDMSLKFFCAIDNGIVLTRMEEGDLVSEFEQRMQSLVEEMGEPQLVIGYDCIHRRIEASQKRLTGQLSQLYQRYKVIGFNTYGEHIDAMHVNHTFTGVAIGGVES